MTRLRKRITNWFAPRKPLGPVPDACFWEALVDVHWRYFEEALVDYVQTGRSPKHIYNSLSTITCWLSIASENGWMNEDEPGK